MRFAIVSYIHGNLPALDAVLEDAKNQLTNEVECIRLTKRFNVFDLLLRIGRLK